MGRGSQQGQISINIRLTGDGKGTSVIDAAGKSLGGMEAAAGKLGAALARATGQGEESFISLGRGITSTLAKIGLVGQGIRTIASAASELGESLLEGARAGDRLDILRGQVEGVDKMIAQAKASTAGMLSEAGITEIIAQFRQFQIPLGIIPDMMAEVAKTSVRTGEDMEYMSSSLVAALARESAMRADNLGVILDADKTKKAFAATIGKEVSALTQVERKGALANEMLRQMQAANQGVNLEMSRTASLERVGTFFEDIWTGIKTGLADAAIGILEWFGVIPERVTPFEAALKGLEGQISDTGIALDALLSDALEAGEILPRMTQQLNRMQEALGREATAGEQQRLAQEMTKEFERQYATLLDLSAALKEAQFIEEQLASWATSTADGMVRQAMAQERVRELTEMIRQLGADYSETQSNIGRETARLVEEEKKRAEAREEALASINEEIEDLRYEQQIVAGISAEEVWRQDVLGRIRKQEEKIREAGADQLAEKRKLVDLLHEQAGAEAAVAAAKADYARGEEMVKRFLRTIREFNRATKARGRGRRRAAPEEESLADLVSLEEARLRAAGELTYEQQEHLAAEEATVKLVEIATAHQRKKITQAKAITDSTRVEYELVGKLLELRKQERRERDASYQLGIDAAKSVSSMLADFEAQRAALLMQLATPKEQIQAGLLEQLEALKAAGQKGLVSPEEQGALEDVAKIQAASDMAREALDGLAEAGRRAAASGDETLSAFGRLAEGLQAHGQEITDVIEEIAAAQAKGAEASVGSIASAVAVSGKLAAAVVKDEQTKAVIMGLVETANAVAAFAGADYVGGALHTVAAALYFAAAGESGSKASAGGGASAGARPRAVAQRPSQAERGYRVEIHVNAPAAIVGGTWQEAATKLGQAVRANLGTGFEAAA